MSESKRRNLCADEQYALEHGHLRLLTTQAQIAQRQDCMTMETANRPAAMGLRLGMAALLALALSGVCRAQPAVALPNGVKAVWDLSKAHKETTPAREKICINGLWLWQPAKGAPNTVPASGWGYFKVPGNWPGHDDYDQKDCQAVFANPAWEDVKLGGVTEAWYQRTINIPADWAGRRIVLSANCLNSYAVVYLDGKKAGTLRYPGGELNVTAHCRPGATQTLSMLVIAVPLHAVMYSNENTFGNAKVQGRVARPGLCGDVWLVGMPNGPRISDFMVDTSVRKWQITFDAGLDALAAATTYRLEASISDHGKPVTEFDSKPFTGADLKDGRYSFTNGWHPAKLWDTITPQNQYDVQLSLSNAGGKPLDVEVPQRFGFREFWIQGHDFYLNGTRIYLFALPFDNELLGAAWSTYDAAKETMLRMKSTGVNLVYSHNYGCAPGEHLSYSEILRAADDTGMLFSLALPHFNAYNWKAPDADQTNGYARTAAYYIRRVAGNHPSVVAYAMSHNSCGYFGGKDPDMLGGMVDARAKAERSPGWKNSNAAHALRTQAIVQRLDPTRVIYHHGCDDLGAMSAINFYVNFTPIQELDDWFGPWSKKGKIPVFLAECGSPLSWDFTMFRGWYHGGREFGGGAVPWELCSAQWIAQFGGDEAMRITNEEKTDLQWESRRFRTSSGWNHWNYPVQLEDIEAIQPIIARYITQNFRAFRTWGLSAFNWWEYNSAWDLRPGVSTRRVDLPVDWGHLQRPGFSPDYIQGRMMTMPTDFKQSDWTPNAAGRAILRNNMPLLACIGGKTGDFTEKGHNFLPGQAVRKQLIIINNSRRTEICDCSWSLALPTPLSGSKQVTIETGNQARIPLTFTLPDSVKPGPYKLDATFKFSTRQGDGGQAGQTQSDSFTIDVMAAPAAPHVTAKVALFDPKGETGKLLDAMKVAYQKVDAEADLSGYGILVVGKGALTVDGPAPDIMGVRNGLRVVVFEQTSDALEKRLGFRTEEYGLRRVFKRVPDSPLLAGLAAANLHDWRGSATLLPPRITFRYHNHYSGEGQVTWCGVLLSHGFRVGCQGNLASVLIEKPACGNFMPILDGGFSLQFSPLMVYREGKGMVLFCQMDVTGRTENDPAAETLAGNIFRYVSNWKATPTDRKAIYVGDPAGEMHLKHCGIVPAAYQAGKLSPADVLVVGSGGGKTLAAGAKAVRAFIQGGGRVLALGLDEEEAKALLPAVETKNEEHISTFFKPFSRHSLLAGIGPADVFDAGAEHPPLVTGGAGVIGGGILAKAHDANVLFFQLPPYAVTSAEGAAQTFTVESAGSPPGLKHNATFTLGTCSTSAGLMGELTTTPLSRPDWLPRAKWEAEAGKTYTIAGLVEGVSGPVKVDFGVQDASAGWSWMREIATSVPAGKWTELHATFQCKESSSGWLVRLNCRQESAVFRVALLRLNEGDYVPWHFGAALPANLVTNGRFQAGTRRYYFQYGEQLNLRRTYRRSSFVMTHLLANLGVACPTPLLSRFASPATHKTEDRWAGGLYVDQVEAWDDPYKSFNW